MARDWRSQYDFSWKPGIIVNHLDPLSYIVHMDSGIV